MTSIAFPIFNCKTTKFLQKKYILVQKIDFIDREYISNV